MSLNWRGRPIRPASQPKREPINRDYADLMRPLGEKQGAQYNVWGSAIVNVQKDGIPPTPSVTPSPSITPSVSISPTPTMTPTPSATPIPQVEISGGTVSDSGGFRTHTITSNTTIDVIQGGNIEIALIGGGGSGGSADGPTTNSYRSGGGGGGGFLYYSAFTATNGSYSAVIGAGGTSPAVYNAGNDGGNTTLFGETAYGGGGGGTYGGGSPLCGSPRSGKNGANGGGNGTCSFQTPTNTSGVGTAIYGTQGTNGISTTAASTRNGGSSTLPASFTSWATTNYSLGGFSGPATVGGPINTPTANTGNGGSGNTGNSATLGSAGASGVILIRYAI